MKQIISNIFGSIFSLVKEPDNSKSLSLGRVSFISMIGVAIYIWVVKDGGSDIPETMQNIIIAIMVYVLGGKVTSKISDIVGAIKQIKGNE